MGRASIEEGTSEEWELGGFLLGHDSKSFGVRDLVKSISAGAGGSVKCVGGSVGGNPGIYLVFRRQYFIALLMLVLRTPLTLL